MNKTVLITGGNRGLGKALVEAFAHAGWVVLGTARNIDSIPKMHNVRGFTLDLAKKGDIISLPNQLKDTKIDLIIHNAGFNPKDKKDSPGYFESTFYLKDFSADNVAESMYINALRPMELTSRLLQNLSDDAIVIAVSSWLGSISKKDFAGHYGYAGSKALMNMCIKGLSLEFDKAPENRVAVALNPGWMKTDMGGSNAVTTPEQVAERVLGMVDDGFFHRNNGKFLNTDRTEHPW